MKPQTIFANLVAPQTWRNGGGQTRELLAWPSADDWVVRISRADISLDGPFSSFPGVQRWFAVLQGLGVGLSFEHKNVELRRGDAPFCFDGAAAPMCRLLMGPTQDLNLMVRSGSGLMQLAVAGQGWSLAGASRGLYTAGPGVWSDGVQQMALDAHTLLWQTDADAQTWHFTADTSAPAFWLAHTLATP